MFKIQLEENNFEKVFAEIDTVRETYLYSTSSFLYEMEYTQNRHLPKAYLFYKQNELMGAFFFIIDESKTMNFFHRPCKVFWKDKASSDDKYEFYLLFLNILEKKIADNEVQKMHLAFDPNLFSGMQNFFVNLENVYESIIDLNSSADIIKRGIRKSFRSLVSWGNREMKFIRIDKNNLNEKLYEDFRLFHIQVSQRETRQKSTWDAHFRMFREGRGFLELGYLNDELVAGALFLTGEVEAYYGVAVNNREMMAEGKAIGHAIIFRAILHAKELGLKICNLGNVGPSFSSDKEYGIAKFKKGFSSSIRLQNSFIVSRQESAERGL